MFVIQALIEATSYYTQMDETIVASPNFNVVGKKLLEKYPCLRRQGSREWSQFTRVLSQRLRNHRQVYSHIVDPVLINDMQKRRESVAGKCRVRLILDIVPLYLQVHCKAKAFEEPRG